MATYTTVEMIMNTLPETEAGPCYGTPGYRVKKKLICRLREDDVLVVKVEDMMLRDGLLQARPDQYFITPHYEDYPAVLVRLSQVDQSELEELLTDAWFAAAPKRLATAFAATQAAS